MAVPLTAFAEPVSQITNAEGGCGADYLGQTWTCNAGEISISQVINLEIAGSPTECVAGDPLLITTTTVEYAMNTTDVRNLTMYWGDQEGTDPRLFAGPGESCTAFSLPGPFNPDPDGTNPFGDIDGDQCGDLAFSVANAVRTFTNVPFTCQDNNADGSADLSVLLTWDNKKNTQDCGTGEGQFFPTNGGTRSKCDYEIRDLGLDIVYPPILTLVKEVTNNNGGENTASQWTLSASGPTPISGATGSPAVTAVEVDAGDYTLGETGPDGYSGTWACDNATVENGNEVTLVNANPAVSVTCTLTNDDIAPTLNLVKVVNTENGVGPDNFTLHVTGGAAACEQDGTDDYSDGDSVTPVCSNTSYTITEEPVSGYALTSITCLDDDDASDVGHPVTMSPGQSVTCTLVNDQIPGGTLTVVKLVNENWNGPLVAGDFSLSITESNGDPCDADLDVTTGYQLNPIEVGCTYTIGETVPDGYQQVGNVVCLDAADGNANLGHPFVAASGVAAVCTITNEDLPAQLTLVKVVDNQSGGDAVEADWNLQATDGNTTEQGDGGFGPTDVAAGTWTLSESGPDGYTAGDWSCVDVTGAQVAVDDNDAIVLANGDVVTCTITNIDIAPTLTLLKTVFNNDGGELEADDFDLVLNGGEYTDEMLQHQATPAIESNTEYTVSETPPQGYTLEQIQCLRAVADGPDEDIGTTFTPNEGDVITCTFINTDDPPTLLIQKVIINDEGGEITDPTAFDITLNGGEYTNEIVRHDDTPVIEGGVEYTVSEEPPEGYEVESIECSIPNLPTFESNGGTFTAVWGETVTCTVTNNDVPSDHVVRFAVVKDFIDDNPGDVTVTLTCNTGSPLTQSAVISDNPGDNLVLFVVQEMVPGPPELFWCEVVETSQPGGYVPLYFSSSHPPPASTEEFLEFAQAHHGDLPTSCRYEGIAEPGYEDPEFEDLTDALNHLGPVMELNYCYILNVPHPVQVGVTKSWDVSGAVGDDYDAETKIRVKSRFVLDGGKCRRHHGDAEEDFHREKCVYLEFQGDATDTQYVWVWPWYTPGPGGVDLGVPVYFDEKDLDSSFEVSNDCGEGSSGMIRVRVGETDAGCSFHNVLFFEGIPTLSQYGLALLALLMLGMGAVTFRRYA